MPWSSDDAEGHTHKATTRALKELWAKVADECPGRTGYEGRAIREANAVVRRQAPQGSRGRLRSAAFRAPDTPIGCDASNAAIS